MISKCIYKKITWIDMESPTFEEIDSIASDYDLPSLVVEEFRAPSYRSKVDHYSKCIYLILRFPALRAGKVVEQEIDFIIGHDFVITGHYEPVNAITEFAKLFEINSTLDRGAPFAHGGFLFFYIIQELYRSVDAELGTVNETLRDIERHIFNGVESKMVGTISATNRTLVDFKQAIRFHNETLTSLERVGAEFFSPDFAYYFNMITGEYKKIQKIVEDHQEILRDLRETNDSLLTAKTNDIITKLTVMNFTMLPLMLITSFFAIHSENYLIRNNTDFVFILVAMAITGILMIMYFKTRKWL